MERTFLIVYESCMIKIRLSTPLSRDWLTYKNWNNKEYEVSFAKHVRFLWFLFVLGSGVYVDSNASIYVVFSSKLVGLWTNYWRRICPKTVNDIGGHLKRRNIRGSQTRFKALIRAFLTSPKSHETEENSWWYNIFYISTTGQIVYATVCEVL